METPNRGYRHQETIGPAAAGRTVLAHLSGRFLRASEATWLARIQAGEVFLDDRPAAPLDPLRAGQRLAWVRPPWIEPQVPLATAILHLDEHLLAVAKPSGLPTLPGGGQFQEHTLLALVRRRFPEASPMHRLGRGTSGIVLFARTEAAGRAMQQTFRDHALRKVYLTLCSGHPVEEAFAVDLPIGGVPHPLLGSLHACSPAGRPSHSEVTVLERRPDCSLVEVAITTGRPHQIRIHLAGAGHPLVGDPLYGPGGQPLPGSTALPGDLGYLLHAWQLAFRHPLSGSPISIQCQPPPALRPGAST